MTVSVKGRQHPANAHDPKPRTPRPPPHPLLVLTLAPTHESQPDATRFPCGAAAVCRATGWDIAMTEGTAEAAS
ncbi:MAG: hypothetical protein WDW38_009170 [Sanguina aurantia]